MYYSHAVQRQKYTPPPLSQFPPLSASASGPHPSKSLLVRLSRCRMVAKPGGEVFSTRQNHQQVSDLCLQASPALFAPAPPPPIPPTPPPSGNSATRPHAPDALLVRLFGLHRAVKPGRRGYWGMSVSLASTTGRTVVIFPPVTPRRGGRRKGIGETLVATSKGASSWICFPEDVSLAPLAGGGVFF